MLGGGWREYSLDHIESFCQFFYPPIPDKVNWTDTMQIEVCPELYSCPLALVEIVSYDAQKNDPKIRTRGLEVEALVSVRAVGADN